MKKTWFFWAGIIAFYLLTRLVNIKIIPIFTDEAIYSYWAQVALHDPVHRFISLEDGKQPLFIWLAAIFQKFVSDPLIATRLVSTAAGLGSLIGIYLLTKELFSAKVARLAAFLYVILPFTLLYDRMALFDSLLTMFGIYAIFFSVRLIREPKLESALLAGIAIGAAMITKSSGIFFLYLLPFSLPLVDARRKILKSHIPKWIFFAAITFLISQIIYNSLRLSPLFYIIARKNLSFIRSPQEVLASPFEFVWSNISSLVAWAITYLSPILFLLFVGCLIYGFVKRVKAIIYLAITIFLPFAAEVLFNKVLYPRFILFYFPSIIILTAFAAATILEKLSNYKKLTLTIFAAVLVIPISTSFKLVTNPVNANIPSSDAGQYLNDWPAGYGVGEIVSFLQNQPANVDIYVGTEGTFGLLPYALQIYFFGQQNIHIIGFWPVNPDNLPQQILDLSKGNPTYFVFNETQREIVNPHLKLIEKFQKGRGDSYMRLYEVTR